MSIDSLQTLKCLVYIPSVMVSIRRHISVEKRPSSPGEYTSTFVDPSHQACRHDDRL